MSDYLRHEALDRSSMLIDMIDRHLIEHEYIKKDDKLLIQVLSAHAILCDVYAEIGDRHMPGESA